MSSLDASPWRERVLSLLRIAAGLMFLMAGTTKLFGFPPGPMPMDPVPLLTRVWNAALHRDQALVQRYVREDRAAIHIQMVGSRCSSR